MKSHADQGSIKSCLSTQLLNHSLNTDHHTFTRNNIHKYNCSSALPSLHPAALTPPTAFCSRVKISKGHKATQTRVRSKERKRRPEKRRNYKKRRNHRNVIMQRAGWLRQSKLWQGPAGGSSFRKGLGEPAQENHSAARNLPARGLKEIADLSVFWAPLWRSCGGGWLEWAEIVGGGGIF